MLMFIQYRVTISIEISALTYLILIFYSTLIIQVLFHILLDSKRPMRFNNHGLYVIAHTGMLFQEY